MLRRFATLLLLLFVSAARAAVVTNGAAISVSVTTNAAGNVSHLFNLAPTGQCEVTLFAPDVLRVRYHFGSLYSREEPAIAKPWTNWPAFATGVSNTATNITLTTSQLRVDIALSNRFRIFIRDLSGRDLLGDHEIAFDSAYSQLADTNGYKQIAWPEGSTGVSNRPAGFKLRATKPMPSGAAYFGHGDFAGPLNRRGNVIQQWAQDSFAFSEFRTPKYTAMPFFYGVHPATTNAPVTVYGLFFNNPARPVFDFSGTTNFTFEAGDDQLDYFVFGGGAAHTMPAVLDRFTELTGRPALWPKWAYGYHQSRHSYDTQQAVLDVAATARASNFPCDAVYLDIDTQNAPGGARQQLTFNSNFTNVPAMVATCSNLGIRLVPIVEPCLLTNDPLYAAALTNLFFIKQNNLQTYVGTNFLGRISWLDFSIAETRDWWRGQLGSFLTNGFTSMWNDLNEPNENAMPLDSIWYLDGRYGGGLVTNDTRKWHAVNKNTFALLEARATYDAVAAAATNIRPFVLSRGAWPGIARVAAGWSGDNFSSFEHLRFNVRLGASMMISGQPMYGHDIGGFAGNCGAELLTRWLQSGALTPYCRNHTINGSTAQEPWVFGEPYTLWNRRWIEFRSQLMPFLYSLAFQCSTNGAPMNAPVAFHFTSDTNTWALNENEYLVGSHLLAAPVFVSNATTRSVYLPAGTDWFGWYDDERIAGGQLISRSASLGSLPLFVRAGAIIPMGPVRLYADQPLTNDYTEIHVWPGTNSFALYDDDSLVLATAKTLAVSGSAQMLTFSTDAAAPFGGTLDAFVIAHAMSNVTAVTLDGAPLPRFANRAATAANGWSYDTVTKRATIRFALGQPSQTLVIATDTLTATNPAFASAFTNIAVAGTFNFWNEAGRNLRLVTNHVWAGVFDLSGHSNPEFKFVANDQWFLGNWGDTGQSDFSPPLAQTAEFDGPDIFVTGSVTGLFTFTFNESNLAYSITSAAATDSDGDGMTDEWEVRHGLDPLGRGDASLDLDGDGFANLTEHVAGTEPTSASSYFAVAGESATTNGVVVSWFAVSGRTYAVHASTNLSDGASWSPLLPFTNVSGAGTLTVTDTNGLPLRHYRVRINP